MAKRALHLPPDQFASLFFGVMLESEGNDLARDEDYLYQVGLENFGDSEKAAAFETRFLATLEVMERPELEEYILQLEDSFKVHPAIFEAASNSRVRINGRFPEKLFLEAVVDAANRKYREFEFGV